METRQYVEKSSKNLVGYVKVLDMQIGVDCQLCREVFQWKDNPDDLKWKRTIGKYFLRGQLRDVPVSLYKYIDWNIVVHLEEFTFRCRLINREGLVESIEPPETQLPPEELWRLYGGM